MPSSGGIDGCRFKGAVCGILGPSSGGIDRCRFKGTTYLLIIAIDI